MIIDPDSMTDEQLRWDLYQFDTYGLDRRNLLYLWRAWRDGRISPRLLRTLEPRAGPIARLRSGD
jgi:hypothetical protein